MKSLLVYFVAKKENPKASAKFKWLKAWDSRLKEFEALGTRFGISNYSPASSSTQLQQKLQQNYNSWV